MRAWLVLLVFLVSRPFYCLYAQSPAVPISYTVARSAYQQNFDGLPASGTFSLSGKGPINLSAAPIAGTGVAGWQILMISGTNANAGFATGTGSSTGNGIYSLGSAGAGDRALGSLSSSSGIYAMGCVLTNQTGGPLNYFTVSFTAEQWRKGGSGNRNTWSFRYKTGVIAHIDQPNLLDDAHLNFSSPINTTGATALPGNQPENQQTVTYTVSGIDWKPGEQLLLRWDDADETGNDDITGIDNFNFSAGLQALAPSIAAAASAEAGTITAVLAGNVNDNHSTTAILFQYDTSSLFAHPQTRPASPDTLIAGSGPTDVKGMIDGLAPGTRYYFRFIASNGMAETVGSAKYFITSYIAPTVITTGVSSVLTNAATITAEVRSTAPEQVLERGVVWAQTSSPATAVKVSAGNGTGIFTQLLSGLPQGMNLFARVYALYPAGTVYGDTIRLSTPTVATSLMPVAGPRTNAASVAFVLRTAQPLAGLTAAHFALNGPASDGAAVSSVTGSGSMFTITVQTGPASGILALSLMSDTGLSLPVYNKPFSSGGSLFLDKQPPQIRQLMIANTSMKIGDTVSATLIVSPDPDLFRISNATLAGIPVTGWVKKNDSTYTASFLIPSGGTDIEAKDDLPFSISVTDAVGNAASVLSSISQTADAIDATRPFIRSVQAPAKSMYKLGDSLGFVFRFSEKISLVGSGAPYLSLTIGGRSRTAAYIAGNQTDSLVFRYLLSADDLDLAGIKTASNISQSAVQVKDLAGNNAVLNFASPVAPGDILVDAVQPSIASVQVPFARTYVAGDTLRFLFQFTKGVLIVGNEKPSVRITIGNNERDLFLSKQLSPRLLSFDYIVQAGDLDKNGVSLGNFIETGQGSLTDSAGNRALLSFKPSALSGVKVDAVAPVFIMAPTETIVVCDNASSVMIGNAFAVTDDEAGELLSWRITALPQHGTISLPAFTATSTGKNVVPAGVIYAPGQGPAGYDTLTTEITDGINSTRKTIIIRLQPHIVDNNISGSQLVCEEKLPALLGGTQFPDSTARYAWEYSTDSIRFNAAAGTRDKPFYTPGLHRSQTWYRRIVTSGACTDTSVTVKITVMKNGIWTGAQNTAWTHTGNWCGGLIPNAATQVRIQPDALYQPMIRDSAWCSDLFVPEGAHLTVSGVLALSGNITAARGSLHAANGTLLCNGTAQQRIDGDTWEANTLHRWVIENNAGVVLTSSLRITGALSLVKGFLETHDQLQLAYGAAIAASANGTAIYGKVSLERRFGMRENTYALFGNPFVNAMGLDVLRDSLAITGEGGPANGFAPSRDNEPSAFYYDPSAGNDSTGFSAGWRPFTSLLETGVNTWRKYAGIRVLMKRDDGKDLASPASPLREALSIRCQGELNTGDQEIRLAEGQAGNRRCYQVVANPYVSNIDLSRVSRSAGVGNHYWVWDPAQGKHGGYTSIPCGSPYVVPAMGAWVVKSNAGGSLFITEQIKTTATTDTLPLYRSDDLFYLEMRLESDSVFHDRILLLQVDSARYNYDPNDAEKLFNPGANLYTLSRDRRQLSTDARPLGNESIVSIGLKAGAGEVFRLRVAAAKLPASSTLMLHDKWLDRWMPLDPDSSYTFTVANDTSAAAEQRFEITSPKRNTDNLMLTQKIDMTLFPVPARHTVVVKYAAAESGSTTLRLYDLSGKPLRMIPLGVQQKGQVLVPIADLTSGIYLVEIRCGNEVGIRKMIKD